MSSGAFADHRKRRSPRWQISLRALVFVVLAAGVSAGIVRSAREVWGSRPIETVVVSAGPRPTAATATRLSPVPVERTAGLILEVEAVFLLLILVRDLTRLLRSGLAQNGGGRATALYSVAWRIASVALLLRFLSAEANVLRLDFLSEIDVSRQQPAWGWNYRLKQNLLPVCGTMLMLGLALGMGAGTLLEEPSTRWRPWWLLAPLAVLAALLLASQPYFSIIPNLVLVALEAVTIAMPHRLVAGPGLSARLVRAGASAALSLALTLPLVLAVARDFERARRRQQWATTVPGLIRRLGLLAAAAAAGAYLACKSLPLIHPSLAQGFAQLLDAGVVFTLVTGFAVFASGLAARSIDKEPTPEKAPWAARLSTIVRCGILAVVSLSVLKCLPSTSQFEPAVPWIFKLLYNACEQANGWLWGRLPDSILILIGAWFEPERLLWTLMVAGVAMLLVELAIRPQEARRAPFDRIVDAPQSIVRFSWLVVALTCVCLVALPTLIVAGQAIIQARLMIGDWSRIGWPR